MATTNVSIPLGTINTQIFLLHRSSSSVSIPLGTINTSVNGSFSSRILVSIPLGTINTETIDDLHKPALEFQFH